MHNSPAGFKLASGYARRQSLPANVQCRTAGGILIQGLHWERLWMSRSPPDATLALRVR